MGMILNKPHQAHRVAWAIHFGEWPKFIDHINGDKTDNRIENLRAVSFVENTRNRKRPTNNSSGHAGIYWHTKERRWVARIGDGAGRKRLGSFLNLDDAVAARRKAEVDLGYHPNHGR
jgi:hypothetical protein